MLTTITGWGLNGATTITTGCLTYIVADDAGRISVSQQARRTFEIGLMLGADLSGDGLELGSMASHGGLRHDGRLDIFVTEFVDQSDTLYHNKGEDGFDDISGNSHIAQPSHPYVGWVQDFSTWTTAAGWISLLLMGMSIRRWTQFRTRRISVSLSCCSATIGWNVR